jgi:predicted ATPase
MDVALARHDAVVRAAIAKHGGYVFSTAGDSFAAAFTTPLRAVSAAVEAQRELAEVGLRVRMAIHVGEAHERQGDYFGPTLSRAARLMAAAHGGQVLISNAVAELVRGQVELRDLGEHWLRDLTSAMRIWQLVTPGLEGEFPPPRTLDQPRSNLPTQRTSFVGRDNDVEALVKALDEARIVTVTGAGGMGKTRLALHVATEALPRFAGGAWLASLADVDSTDAVSDLVLAAVGGRRQLGGSALSSLSEIASGRRLLIVLDNCEHVLEAAAQCAEAIVAAGDSVVLATSREPLAVAGERVVPVSSLPGHAAVALFTDRARAVDPSFAVDEKSGAMISEICRRLDGMPLALELAAARVRSMSLDELGRRLDARFRLLRGGPHGVVARHRTLRAAIEWSYDLLEPAEQYVFDRLSVFAGGFTAEAVVAVVSDESMDDVDAVIVLDTLVARSMVAADRRRSTTRYSLLETLRQFGEDRLLSLGQAAASRAGHARQFLHLAEAARQQLSTPLVAQAMTVFADEWDNLRIAFDWLVSNADVDGALRLVIAVRWFAILACQSELLSWGERAIALERAREHDLWTAAAGATADVREWTGDVVGADRLATEALRQHEGGGTPPPFELVVALFVACWSSGQVDRALQTIATLENVAERDQDPLELGMARFYRALVYVATDLQEVGSFADDAVDDAEATGNPHQLAFAYAGLLAIAAGQHDLERARFAYTRARQWSDRASNRLVSSMALFLLAMASPEDQPLAVLAVVREALATFDFDATGLWSNLAAPLGSVVMPLVRLGRYRPAALLLGGISALPSSPPDTQQVVPRASAALEQELGQDFHRLLNEGRLLTRQELLRVALDEIETCLDKP